MHIAEVMRIVVRRAVLRRLRNRRAFMQIRFGRVVVAEREIVVDGSVSKESLRCWRQERRGEASKRS